MTTRAQKINNNRDRIAEIRELRKQAAKTHAWIPSGEDDDCDICGANREDHNTPATTGVQADDIEKCSECGGLPSENVETCPSIDHEGYAAPVGPSVQTPTTGVHTATPFGEVPCSLERNGKGNGNSFELLNEAGFPIARIYDEERAAFILRAVNSHDKLVEQVKELREMLDIIVTNAQMIPDPAMQGATDIYAVPLDDIDNAEELLKKGSRQ